MKNLFKISFLGLLMMGLFTACETDTIGGGNPGGGPGGGGEINEDAPSLRLVERDGFVSTSAIIAPGSTFQVNLLGARGATDLLSVEFDIDGAPFGSDEAISRVTINNAQVLGDNVAVDDGSGTGVDERASFDWVAAIIASEEETTQTYMFRLIDVDGLTDEVEVIITTDSSVTGGGGGDVVPPTININMNSVIVGPNSLFSIPIDIVAGNPLLSQIGVFEVMGTDTMLIQDLNRLVLGGVTFPSNPFELVPEDRDGFQKDLLIRSQNNESLTTYIIVFSDDAGNLYQSQFMLDTRPQGNPVRTIEGVLFNSAGPSGFGGLDLDSGVGTGSTDASAELRDNGIDNTVPLGENWLQTISGINETQVQYLVPGQNGLPGDFTFESVSTDLDIAAVSQNGTDFTLTNGSDLTSNPVNVGDMFIANRDNQIYIFIVREVNVTGDDNMDNYVMDITL